MDWFLHDNGLRHERVKHIFLTCFFKIIGANNRNTLMNWNNSTFFVEGNAENYIQSLNKIIIFGRMKILDRQSREKI